MSTLQIPDYIVLGVYSLGMLAIGIYYSLRSKTSEEYMLGKRGMKSWMVGLSLFATLVSSISYLASPGEMIKNGPMLFSGMLSFPFVYWITGWFVIPRIMRENVSSAYEFLEIKLGRNVRILSSIFFLSMRLIWMAVIIFMSSEKVIVPIMHWPDSYIIPVSIFLGAITVIYTSLGGIRAVVLTDTIQSIILFLGAILTIIVITIKMGGIGQWWPTVWNTDWAPFKLNYDPSARVTVIGAFISYLGWYVCTAGSDQMAIQRYLSTSDIRHARRAQLVSLIGDIGVTLLLALVGLCLLGYFRIGGASMPEGWSVTNNADQLFPYFIVSGLPKGVSGLIIAGLLAASMSSLSSGVNSSALVICNDLLKKDKSVRLAQYVSLLTGIVVILLSTLVRKVSGNLLEITYKTTNLLVAPLFVPFFMALFIRFAKAWPVFIGMLTSVGIAATIAYWKELTGQQGISFLWIIPSSFLGGVMVSVLLSLPNIRFIRK